jgi:hypothetical protein
MTTPVTLLPLSTPNGNPARKKRVLLLDTSQTKRDLWRERSRAGTSSALICGVRFRRKELLSSSAGPSIWQLRRILTKLL